MKTGKKLALMIGLVVVYILVINFIAAGIGSSNTSVLGEDSVSSGETIKLGVSDSVSVSVVRERFYGVYHISNGNNNLFLLWLIKVPVEIKGFSFFWIHLIFTVSCGVTWWLLSDEKVYKEKDTYFEYEKLA